MGRPFAVTFSQLGLKAVVLLWPCDMGPLESLWWDSRIFRALFTDAQGPCSVEEWTADPCMYPIQVPFPYPLTAFCCEIICPKVLFYRVRHASFLAASVNFHGWSFLLIPNEDA